MAAREPAKPRGPRELPRSVEQLTQLADNRASAAELLASAAIYSKLRRFGLGDLNSDSGDDRQFFAVAVTSHACALPWRWCC